MTSTLVGIRGILFTKNTLNNTQNHTRLESVILLCVLHKENGLVCYNKTSG